MPTGNKNKYKKGHTKNKWERKRKCVCVCETIVLFFQSEI